MKVVPDGSFERLSGVEALWRAWGRYARGKGRRPSVAAFSVEADRHVFALHRALVAGGWRPGPFHLKLVRDPKPRLIAAPAMGDRIVHEAVVHELGPTFARSFIDHSYACRAGLGPERAALRYLTATRRFPWRLDIDIRRYFPSVRHDALLGLLGRRIRDAETLALLARLVVSGAAVYRAPLAVRVLGLVADPLPPGTGLAIGSAFSQWAANVYLDGVDHLVQRRIRPGAYQRYMDDLTLFSHSRARLVEAREEVGEWLAQQRGLATHRGEVVSTAAPSTYLGCRVSRAGRGPGRKLRRRMRRRVLAAAERGPEALKRTLASYRARVRFG